MFDVKHTDCIEGKYCVYSMYLTAQPFTKKLDFYILRLCIVWTDDLNVRYMGFLLISWNMLQSVLPVNNWGPRRILIKCVISDDIGDMNLFIVLCSLTASQALWTMKVLSGSVKHWNT